MNNRINKIFKGDKVIWMIFFFLCIISVIEVFSASSGLTYKRGNYMLPIIKHFGLLMVGIVSMVVTLNIECKYFKTFTPFLYPISIFMLLAVLFMGHATNDAHRWIEIFGIQFQPSELAKGAVVMCVAQILSAMQTDYGADKKAFRLILAISGGILLLIAVENLSTAALLALVVFMMMIIGNVPRRQLLKLVLYMVGFIVLVITFVMVVGQEDKTSNPEQNMTEQVSANGVTTGVKQRTGLFHRFDTWKSRIHKFVNHQETPPEKVDLDKDAQVAHSNIAIVSSNFIGKGPGNSVERDFLSQAFSDFIYAIIIEELGLFGAIFVAALYVFLLFRTAHIAQRCENNYPAYLAMGLALLLVTQALFNMGVAVGLFPVTGQPLPLISKGGTSSIINCVYIGMILSVSRSAKRIKEVPQNEAQPAMA